MEGNKGYRGGNDLFVCFPSRTSMRLVPKLIFSPARTEKGKDSGSTGSGSSSSSSSRRKGQSSPMFPLLLRRKNANYETTEEPSSPKVTCIGQVRVKSKRGRRWSFASSGRGSCRKRGHIFRKEVCEALRSFGSEFNCFLPCSGAPPTSPVSKEGAEKQSTTCGGAVFAKWLMILHEGDEKHHQKLDPGGKVPGKMKDSFEEHGERIDPYEKGESPCENYGEKIDMYDIHEDPYEKNKEKMFPDEVAGRLSYEEDDERWAPVKNLEEGSGRDGYDEEDEDVPICTPPRNALLLMRCRSDPLRVSLDSGLWMAHSGAGEPEKTCEILSDSDDSSEVRPASYEEASNDEEEHREFQRSEDMETLPDALFLMSCEPGLTKLSLEVCKETWVSSRDFFRRPMVSQDDSRRLSKEGSDPDECSAGSVGINKMLEEKFSPHKALVLTRCKSEPVKVSVKIAPEVCLWKRRNLGKPLSLNI